MNYRDRVKRVERPAWAGWKHPVVSMTPADRRRRARTGALRILGRALAGLAWAWLMWLVFWLCALP